MSMYSFDVYDTIITRKVYEPKGIWELMSFFLLQDANRWDLNMSFKVDFVYIRSEAEKQARKKDSYEITIDDIYDIIKDKYDLSQETCFRLIHLEMECELNNTIIIEENIDKIRKLKELGEEVVLISDMYLPKTFFVKLFNKICPLLNDLKLYLSCDIGITKVSGLMYEYVSSQENVHYSQWIHEGDNIVSDVNVPELYGISTIFYSKTENNDLIKRMDNVIRNNSLLLRQYLLGMIKRITIEATHGYRIGYGFVGVALYTYVEWILKQADKRKIKRLYFIARDGYILKKIADVIIKEYGLDIKTFYLYGSRNAWRTDNKEQQELVLQYMEQEFMGDYTSMALVDTQGTGHSIECLSNISGRKFVVFYYALLGNMINKGIIPISFSAGVGGSIIEVLCRAPHGSTVGYTYQEGKIIPKLKLVNEDVYKRADIFSYFKGVEDFAKDFAELNNLVGEIPKENISKSIVEYCLKTPDRKLADFLGEIPFDENNESEMFVYAPKLTTEMICKIELERTMEKLDAVYTGDELDISYCRLNSDEKEYLERCKEEFSRKTKIKSNDALKIIIYGFGVYGKELYHRLYLNTEFEIVDIVDVNYERFAGKIPIINPIKNINMQLFDILVISLYDKKISKQIRKMLVSAGIDNKKILDLEEFEKYEPIN